MTNCKRFDILICVEREWRNRQTRTFEGRVGRLVRVQVPSLAPKKNRYHLVSVLFYCVKQYSLSVLLQNCADAILQRGGICEIIVMLLLATAFNYGAYSDESPVRAPKISSNHLVAAYFLYAYRCGLEAVFIFGVPTKPIRLCGERRSIRSDCCIITRDNV